MRCKVAVVALALLLLAACSGTQAGRYTPLPYEDSDSTLLAVGKTLVNFPVWTAETAAALAFMAAYLWALSGAPGATR